MPQSTSSSQETPHRSGDEESPAGESEFSLLPWWRRPSAWWMMAFVPFSAAIGTAKLAPQIELYIALVCGALRPEYTADTHGTSFHTPAGALLSQAMPFVSFSSLGGISSPDLCAADPVVQAAVAKLSTVLSMCIGVVSCITNAWWGSFSDRHGRVTLICISMIGFLVDDINFIFVARFARSLPGNYWFLMIGLTFEGLLGGMTATIAAVNAYMADCTVPASRSRVFSLFFGLLMLGSAVGPFISALIFRMTGNNLAIFYIAGVMHLVVLLVLRTLCPESLSKKKMAESRRRHAAHQDGLTGWKRLFAFLSPLAILWPQERKTRVENGVALTDVKTGRDWNLLLVAIGYGSILMLFGSTNSKFQYTSYVFGWKTDIMGYWLTLSGITRAVHLVIILPVIIRLFKPSPIRLPLSPSEHLRSSSSTTPNLGSPRDTLRHSPTFDLGLARWSLVIELLSYILIGFIPAPLAFTLFSMLGAFSAGFMPAVKSVALDLYAQREGLPAHRLETGKLFGALSVVQALSMQILGPTLFGLVYVKTVAIFPRAIFFLAALADIVSFVALSLVRLTPNLPQDAHAQGPEEEDELLGGEGLAAAEDEELIVTAT